MRAGEKRVSGGTGLHFSQYLQPGEPDGGKMVQRGKDDERCCQRCRTGLCGRN